MDLDTEGNQSYHVMTTRAGLDNSHAINFAVQTKITRFLTNPAIEEQR